LRQLKIDEKETVECNQMMYEMKKKIKKERKFMTNLIFGNEAMKFKPNSNSNDEEFIGFKNNVKEWLTLDDDIITLQKAIKERKIKKDQLTPKILNFMDKFNINDLNTEGGKIKFTKSLYTKPLNKQFLISKLGDFFKDFKKGEKAASFILENRDKEERCKIRRVANKN
jgi:hypothetical protein